MILLIPDLPGYQKYFELQTRVGVLEGQIQHLQAELDKEKKQLEKLAVIYNPSVSISEVNVRGINYLKGSFQLKLSNGKVFRSTIHIGRTDRFTEGKDDPMVTFEAQQKIKKVLETKLKGKI